MKAPDGVHTPPAVVAFDISFYDPSGDNAADTALAAAIKASPTKNEQGDLLPAMFGRHGESPIPIVAPCSPADCFSVAMEAARVAIRYRTPVILLTGDDKTVQQAQPVLGEVEYVAVKKSLGYFQGEHLPLKESHARIREAAKRAVARFSRARPTPPKAELPVTFELDLARHENTLVTKMKDENLRFVDDDTSGALADVELIAEHEPVQVRWPETVSFTCNRYADAYNLLFRILMYFYERDIEWLLEEIADPERYKRDFARLVGDSPLNYVG